MTLERRVSVNPSQPAVKFAPREIFEQILEYSVIPTFDLIVELPHSRGIVMVRRIIAPYENQWALPGLRMFKPERIEHTISRIAKEEIGVCVRVDDRRFIGQYVGHFRTEHQRQDLSTCYVVKSEADTIDINRQHFSGYRIVKSLTEIPRNTGAMYRYYLKNYFP